MRRDDDERRFRRRSTTGKPQGVTGGSGQRPRELSDRYGPETGHVEIFLVKARTLTARDVEEFIRLWSGESESLLASAAWVMRDMVGSEGRLTIYGRLLEEIRRATESTVVRTFGVGSERAVATQTGIELTGAALMMRDVLARETFERLYGPWRQAALDRTLRP